MELGPPTTQHLLSTRAPEKDFLQGLGMYPTFCRQGCEVEAFVSVPAPSLFSLVTLPSASQDLAAAASGMPWPGQDELPVGTPGKVPHNPHVFFSLPEISSAAPEGKLPWGVHSLSSSGPKQQV